MFTGSEGWLITDVVASEGRGGGCCVVYLGGKEAPLGRDLLGWRSSAARASVCGVATSCSLLRRVGVLCRLGAVNVFRLLVVATYSW